MKKLLLLICVILFLASCAGNHQKEALDLTERYVTSLAARDLKTQMELLRAFEMKEDIYEKTFLRFVEGADLLDMKQVYEDDYIIIIELHFELVLSKDFPANDRLNTGANELRRYFTYYKNQDMLLKEILDQLIK